MRNPSNSFSTRCQPNRYKSHRESVLLGGLGKVVWVGLTLTPLSRIFLVKGACIVRIIPYGKSPRFPPRGVRNFITFRDYTSTALYGYGDRKVWPYQSAPLTTLFAFLALANQQATIRASIAPRGRTPSTCPAQQIADTKCISAEIVVRHGWFVW